MEEWKDMYCFIEDDYMFFYCPHCKKVYEMNECKRTIIDQPDVNYYRDDLDCRHCRNEVKYVFTNEDDLQEWLEDLLNFDDELPLNIKVITDKDHYEDGEHIKVKEWQFKE